MTIQRMEHVGIVVDDLAAATAFFVEQGDRPATHPVRLVRVECQRPARWAAMERRPGVGSTPKRSA
jgi:catechol 2,3-dioxygenase-like lactoylglutathione lyase family enzyme